MIQSWPDINLDLKNLGFKDKEIKTYITLLQLGNASMTELAQTAGLKRPITYVCIDELMQKNLVAKIHQGSRDVYQALPFESMVYEHIKKTELARKVANEIHKINTIENSPRTTYYKGKKQFEYILDHMLRSKELWGIAYIEEYWKIFGEKHNRHLFELLKRAGGIVHHLMPKTPGTIKLLQTKHRKGLQEIRFLPSGFSTENKVGLIMNENKVMINSFHTMTATLIEDENIVKLQKQMWQTLWDQSEPFIEKHYDT